MESDRRIGELNRAGGVDAPAQRDPTGWLPRTSAPLDTAYLAPTGWGAMGPALCLLSAACFGAMAIFGKLAYAEGISTGDLLLVRFTLAAGVLLGLATMRRGRRPEPRDVLIAVLGLGAIGYAAQAACYFGALEVMDASLLAIVFYTYPAMVTLAAAVLGRDQLSRARVAALVAASAGVVLVLLGAGAGAGALTFPIRGVSLAFGAAAIYTAYILVSDAVIRRLPAVLLAGLVMMGASATLWARSLLLGGPRLEFGARGWLWLGCIALVSTVLAMVTFFAGLRRTGPSTAAILSTFEPVVTTALAAAALGEALTSAQLVGGVLVVGSVAVLQRGARRTPRSTTRGEPAPPAASAPG